jgi:hypothetical protein
MAASASSYDRSLPESVMHHRPFVDVVGQGPGAAGFAEIIEQAERGTAHAAHRHDLPVKLASSIPPPTRTAIAPKIRIRRLIPIADGWSTASAGLPGL